MRLKQPARNLVKTYNFIVRPILDFSGSEDGVEDDAEEVDGGGDDEDVMPLHFDEVMG